MIDGIGKEIYRWIGGFIFKLFFNLLRWPSVILRTSVLTEMCLWHQRVALNSWSDL